MLMLNVVYIRLAAHGRTLRLRAHAIKMQVNGVFGNLVRLHYPSEVTQNDGTSSSVICWVDYAIAPDAMYGTAHGSSVERLLGKIFGHPFSKFYPLCT
jgi:hypothetical protein